MKLVSGGLWVLVGVGMVRLRRTFENFLNNHFKQKECPKIKRFVQAEN